MLLTDQNLHLCILPEGKAEKFYTDDDLPGFGIRVRREAGGHIKRKWFYQYRSKTDGAQHRINLGNVDRPAAVPTTKARQAATALSERVQLGGNPQAERKEAKQDRRRLLLDAALSYREDRRAGVVGKRPMRFEKHWAALARRPVAAITDGEVKAELRKIIEKHGRIAAKRALTNLSAFYSWAMREGLARSNPTLACHVISENPPRDRTLSDNEIAAIWHACRDDDFGRIIRLLFLTGCRRAEIGGVRWSEINPETGVLTIPADRVKNGRALRLTLSAPALDIIRTAPRKAGRDFLFGFTGAAGYGNRWGYDKLMIDKRLADGGHQFAPWTLHDIRRSVRTGMAKLGGPTLPSLSSATSLTRAG